jgi:probable phosphoglycerate mutase
VNSSPVDLSRLANRYSVMRHGQSRANAAGVIVSSIEADRAGDWGLTEAGREQARGSAAGCGLPAGTVIVCSDFARARQTADIVRGCLGAAEATVAAELRERFFGAFDGTSTANYKLAWEADEAGAAGPGVEAPAAVLGRAVALVAALEARYAGRDVLLVSHGDTLQILQAGFAGLDPRRHRRLPHLETAEVRRLRPPG